jgi:hypothetical protein
MTYGWAGAERFCPNRDGAEPGDGVSRRCGITLPRACSAGLRGSCPLCRGFQGRGTGRIVLGCLRRRNAARSAGTRPPQTPCWPISQCRSDSSRHWVRTRQVVQTVIAAAASWRALSASALTGNHWSGSRVLSAQRSYLTTRGPQGLIGERDGRRRIRRPGSRPRSGCGRSARDPPARGCAKQPCARSLPRHRVRWNTWTPPKLSPC